MTDPINGTLCQLLLSNAQFISTTSSLWLRYDEKTSFAGTGIRSFDTPTQVFLHQGTTFLSGIIFLIDHLAANGSQYSGDLIRAHKNHYCSHWGHYQETLNVLKIRCATDSPTALLYQDYLRSLIQTNTGLFFLSSLSLLPTFLLPDLLASLFHTDWLSWLGLSNQVGSTTDHF